MNFVGVDLHKHSISVCTMVQAGTSRTVTARRRFHCEDEEQIQAFFAALGPFEVVIEATASYEWFVKLVEPLAERVVLAHPKKLRVIAESAKKSDKLDAQTLAEFLALDMVPASWRPTPRVREHRTLVRLRYYTQRRITATKNKLRRVLSDYNADIRALFTRQGRRYLAQVPLSDADRFHAQLLTEELDAQLERRRRIDRKLREFAERGSLAEQEARRVLASIPGVAAVTTDVVLSEVGDIRRFRSQRKATTFAGLAPGVRESAGRVKHLGITKEGSRLLRSRARADRLAARQSHPPLELSLRTTQGPRGRQEGHRRRRPPRLVRDGRHAQERHRISRRCQLISGFSKEHGRREERSRFWPCRRRIGRPTTGEWRRPSYFASWRPDHAAHAE